MDRQQFVDRWLASGGSERANKDLFFAELCDVLGVARPEPARGDPAVDRYTFERDALLRHDDGSQSIGKIDLYKEGCVVFEAKQGSETGSKKHGSGKRDTQEWYLSMRAAYGQALKYVDTLDHPPPFIVACDIGHCFDLYASFDGRADYHPFPNARANRLWFRDLADHLPTLKAIFEDPLSLDPARRATKITREVAGHLADLARALEQRHRPEAVAEFLMRCIFTMFAASARLLPDRLFVDLIEKQWLPHPERFEKGVQALWRTMDKGGYLAEGHPILQFNGGLFQDPSGLPLEAEHLALLLEAARCDWSEVEPSIFGTLLERALDPRERHRLGAHYTPRAYVERLVRATVEEPLRAEWQEVQAALRIEVEKGKLAEAKKLVRAFYQKLCKTRVLDPACGTGNFLYVTLDLFKRLETEVWAQLAELGESQERLEHEGSVVTPAQFHGIEVNGRAKEIAELVLWIGHLQWHLRTHGRAVPPPEPVLRNYKNIEHRDAVLAYDREEILTDAKGKPVMRWDGVTTKRHPATGEEVPDETARAPVYKYVNPRPAEWPEVEYIVGNPPFMGKLKLLSELGAGYAEALRDAYAGQVPDGSDFVMYWWFRAASLARANAIKRFGLITTNSIWQTFSRRVVAAALDGNPPISLIFAVPDHPWVESADGAAVRIAMTVGAGGNEEGRVLRIRRESEPGGHLAFDEVRGKVHADLTVGADVTTAVSLEADGKVSGTGLILGNRGFVLDHADTGAFLAAEPKARGIVFPLRNGEDLTDQPRCSSVIDTDGWLLDDLRRELPLTYQRLYDRVYPERQTNRDPRLRREWWLFRRSNRQIRGAIKGLLRYIATSETARHRVFVFLDAAIRPEHKLVVVGLDDAFYLGVLSSRPHVVWALASGGKLGIGNDPVYSKTTCFEKYPFPLPSPDLAARIRQLGEDLDAHRKRQQAAHPELTITGMYNVLEKLRAGESLDAKEKVIHEQGLVSVLRQIHDDLDAAVFETYGWPKDLTDEQILERLVALNAERAEEERKGLVRWLRPDFQAKGAAKPVQIEAGFESAAEPTAAAPLPWPKPLPERIAAVRNTLRQPGPHDLDSLAARFKRPPKLSKADLKTDLEAVLQSLAALGLAVTYDTPSGTKWRLTLRAAA